MYCCSSPVAQDLREFRLSRGRPDDGELVFPARDGGPWNQWALDHWRGRVFRGAKEAVGIEDATPYTLRHSFASLLIWEGRPITYVAAQLGHSPAMTLRTYAHVFEELEDADRTTAEARSSVRVGSWYLLSTSPRAVSSSEDRKSLQTANAPSRIRTCGLLLRRESLCPAELSGRARSGLASAASRE
jgi:hypothetical protein